MEILKLKRFVSRILNKRLYFKYKSYISKQMNFSDTSNKIVLISHESNDSGAVILLLEMVKEFHRKKFEIIVLTRNYGPLIKKASEYAYVEVFSNKWQFKKIVKKAYMNNFRNVICNTAVNGDLPAILKKQLFNVITLVHELPKVIQLINVENRARLLAIHSDIVVFPSKYVLDKFPYISQVRGKSLIKPQGVNFTTGVSITRDIAKKRLFDLYSIPQEHKLVLGVGLGDERKGYDIFLDLAEKSLNRDISFVWVGIHSKEIYHRKIKSYGVDKLENLYQVGFVDDKLILSSFYAAADVFALTSREDPFPSVVLQAFNAKLPVIAFRDAGGFVDVVTDEVTGFLVEYENVDKMFSKLNYLLENPIIRTNMGNNAKDKMYDYDFADYINYFIHLFE